MLAQRLVGAICINTAILYCLMFLFLLFNIVLMMMIMSRFYFIHFILCYVSWNSFPESLWLKSMNSVICCVPLWFLCDYIFFLFAMSRQKWLWCFYQHFARKQFFCYDHFFVLPKILKDIQFLRSTNTLLDFYFFERQRILLKGA